MLVHWCTSGFQLTCRRDDSRVSCTYVFLFISRFSCCRELLWQYLSHLVKDLCLGTIESRTPRFYFANVVARKEFTSLCVTIFFVCDFNDCPQSKDLFSSELIRPFFNTDNFSKFLIFRSVCATGQDLIFGSSLVALTERTVCLAVLGFLFVFRRTRHLGLEGCHHRFWNFTRISSASLLVVP